jgi:hypothetical protein
MNPDVEESKPKPKGIKENEYQNDA